MRKRMKSKGYAKGGAKMMKAMRGKMAKGYAKGGAKMMKAMGGRMMAKGMAKASFMKNSGKQGQKTQNKADVTIATFTKALKSIGMGNRVTANDINKAKRQLLK